MLRITATATGTVQGQTVSTTNTVETYINTSTYTIYRMAGGKGIAFGDIARKFGVEVKADWPFYTHGKEITELLVDVAHPIGSVIETLDETFNPNEQWPWTRWSLLKDCFLYGAGTKNVLDQGGSENSSVNITLDYRNMPLYTAFRYSGLGSGGQPTPRKIALDNSLTSNGYTTIFAMRGQEDHSGTYGTDFGIAEQRYEQVDPLEPVEPLTQTLDNMPPYIVVNMWTRIQ